MSDKPINEDILEPNYLWDETIGLMRGTIAYNRYRLMIENEKRKALADFKLALLSDEAVKAGAFASRCSVFVKGLQAAIKKAEESRTVKKEHEEKFQQWKKGFHREVIRKGKSNDPEVRKTAHELEEMALKSFISGKNPFENEAFRKKMDEMKQLLN